ncbi:TIGR04076 family protein [Candidatus Bipolaricaulota bacterium]|nr:TIGR04076 family protein [Candidatus Bipolaricaulota bacterium]
MSQVRISVAKRALYQDLVNEYVKRELFPGGFGLCSRFIEGQSYLVDWPAKPDGFPCDWAWADIQRAAAMIGFGADAPWVNRPGTTVICCNDGLRPVTFVIERVEGDAT